MIQQEIGSTAHASTILGLDLGANSIGWALLEAHDGKPSGLIDAGVRIFEAGMEGDIASGKGESRGVKRRDSRQARRQTDRRKRRKQKVLHALQRFQLLPEGQAEDFLPELDAQLLAKATEQLEAKDPQRHHIAQVLPYHLRAEALRRPLDPFELGRALYHLCQRRGFKSNRKTRQKAGEDLGQVKKAIGELREKMEDAGAPTLGAYLATLDPEEKRIRTRYTARDMFEQEFDQIVQAQGAHHPALQNDENIQSLKNAIFHQRPLRSARNLIGRCTLEPKKRRLAKAFPLAQTFRILQQVNHARVICPDGEERPLDLEERSKLIEALEHSGDLTFTKAKKEMGLKRTHTFSLSDDEGKCFLGNRTSAEMKKAFGDRWFDLPNSAKRDAIEDILSFEDTDALKRRAVHHWHLTPEQADAFCQIQLEPGYAALSRKAMTKLLPFLKEGQSYTHAIQSAYGRIVREVEKYDSLPPLYEIVEVRNPVVTRVLAEVRKVVNAILRSYGRPDLVRIELARDLRQTQAQRKKATTRIGAREKQRKDAAEKILEQRGIKYPSRDDILKVLLADECDWECPYTGKGISMEALMGDNPQFDIEHIVPFSRSLDDSYFNKTLCHHEYNRNHKANRTPREACTNPQEWEEILVRVSKFKGEAAEEKLRRFHLTSEEVNNLDDFVSTQLNDTRYASRLAMQYLAGLYGGVVDDQGKRRIQATRGQVTAFLREGYDLNRILGDNTRKSRNDHRHHAIDALCTALTTPGGIQQLSQAALQAWQREGKKRRIGSLPEPWDDFHQQVRQKIDGILTSHRIDRKVNGPLHQDTYYRERECREDGKAETFYGVRKPLVKMSNKEVQQIVDPRVRDVVQDALARSPVTKPDKAFAQPEAHPWLTDGVGNRVNQIHRATIRSKVSPRPIGDPKHPRLICSESNHHLEVVAQHDKNGQVKKWVGFLVDRVEAMRRKRAGEPIVKKDHGPGMRFVFSIAPGDCLHIPDTKGEPDYVIIRSVSQQKTGATRVEYTGINDAQLKADIKKAKGWFSPSTNGLLKRHARKVVILPLGIPRRASD